MRTRQLSCTTPGHMVINVRLLGAEQFPIVDVEYTFVEGEQNRLAHTFLKMPALVVKR